jgi:hypothetical protein
MPNCYACGKETPATEFYLLRNHLDKEERNAIWFYTCLKLSCLKALVLDKAYSGTFLLREYRTNHGRSWSFKNKQELMDFIAGLKV